MGWHRYSCRARASWRIIVLTRSLVRSSRWVLRGFSLVWTCVGVFDLNIFAGVCHVWWVVRGCGCVYRISSWWGCLICSISVLARRTTSSRWGGCVFPPRKSDGSGVQVRGHFTFDCLAGISCVLWGVYGCVWSVCVGCVCWVISWVDVASVSCLDLSPHVVPSPSCANFPARVLSQTTLPTPSGSSAHTTFFPRVGCEGWAGS